MKRPIQWLTLAFCCGAGFSGAYAAPLYQQQVEQAKPDQEALKHSAEKLRDHKDVEIQKKLLIQPFHKQDGELETAPSAFCRDCHGPLPHSKQLRSRAFMNMHVRFIACETCHFRPKDTPLEYHWYDYEKQQPVAGKGLFRLAQKQLDNSKQRPANPKIAPFYQGQPAFVTKDASFSKDIAEQWKTAALEEKIPLRARIHQPLQKKGPECKTCHSTDKAMLNLPALGATTEETQAMQKHVIPQFFGRYEKEDQRITIREMLR
jgi:RNase P subunit RPR2